MKNLSQKKPRRAAAAKFFSQVARSVFSSYACVVLIYVLISYLAPQNFPPITNARALELFATCAAVVITQLLIMLLPLSFFATNALFFLDMVVIVFGMGYFVFDFFGGMWLNCVLIFAMLVAVYAVIFLISFFEDYKSMNEINEIIQMKN